MDLLVRPLCLLSCGIAPVNRGCKLNRYGKTHRKRNNILSSSGYAFFARNAFEDVCKTHKPLLIRDLSLSRVIASFYANLAKPKTLNHFAEVSIAGV